MRMYRLGDGVSVGGWPFLSGGHAYLPDGTALTEQDENGRIVPAERVLKAAGPVCAGGRQALADRRDGVEALARALDRDDRVRAPILLLQLQIDEAPNLGKYNPFHKPPGPGGGQFTFSAGNDAVWRPANSPLGHGDIEPVAQDMHVGFNSTYQKGIYGEDIDRAHDVVMTVVTLAILKVGSQNFRPGMDGYGRKLHDEVAALITALGDPNLFAEPVYLGGEQIKGGRPKGSSAPDIYYRSPTGQLVVWELKTGRATDLQSPDNVEQKDRTLKNIPGVLYEYIQVYEK